MALPAAHQSRLEALLLLSSLLFLASPCPAATPTAVERGPMPAWVEPVVVDLEAPVPTGPVRESAQYLLVDDQVRVGGGPLQRYFHGAWRLVTREALEQMSRLEVDYDPSYTRVVLHRLRVWRADPSSPGRWEDRLEQAWITEIQQETALWQHLFDGVRTLMVVMPDVRVGDVVEYAYTLEGFNPVFGPHYLDDVDMAWSVPAGRRTLRIRWPRSREIFLRSHGDVPPPAMVEEAGEREARWDLSSVPPIPTEYDVPPDVETVPWLQVSEFPSWSSVAAWALPLYASRPSPRTRALATEVCRGTTPEERAAACLRWVQDEVRYFGIEMGAGSHAPNDPDAVVDRRYGDCKDKSLLLVTLLDAVGIPAWPALVSGQVRGGVAAWHPSPMAFDHVVVNAEIDGRAYWMDPTLSQQGGGLADLWVAPFGVALPVREGTRDLVPVPTAPEGSRDVTHAYLASESADMTRLTVESRFTGRQAEAARAWLADISEADLTRQSEERFQRVGWEARLLEPVRIQDDRRANVLVMEESYQVGGAWTPDPLSGSEVLELYPLDLFDTLPEPGGADRAWPFALPLGSRDTGRVRAILPPGWALQGGTYRGASTGGVTTPWFRFGYGRPVQGSTEEINFSLDITADRVLPAEVDRYLEASDDVRQASACALVRPSGGRRGWRPADHAGVLGFIAGLGLGAVVPAGFMGLMALWSAARGRRREDGEPAGEG